MSDTPRTDNFYAQTITMTDSDALSGWLQLSTTLETELADKDRQLAEAQAELERLNKQLDEFYEQLEQMREALEEAIAIHENAAGGGHAAWYAKAKAALDAAKGE